MALDASAVVAEMIILEASVPSECSLPYRLCTTSE
jgi:hypothetical protein